MSRNEAWNGDRTDVQRTPIFPFGSRVKSHVPLTLQTWDTTRCRDGIVIDRARNHKGSIVIRHKDTMKTVVRYTYKVLGQRDIASTGSDASTAIGFLDEAQKPELFFDHLSGVTTTRRVADTLQQDGTKYRPATKADLTAAQQRDYLSKVNMHFSDGSTGVPYKIVGIDFLVTGADGRASKISKTPMFRHFNTDLYEFEPRDAGDFEWIPCAELLRDPDTTWNYTRNTFEANSAELVVNMLSRTLENDFTGEYDCYREALNTITASRASVTDIPPPKNLVI